MRLSAGIIGLLLMAPLWAAEDAGQVMFVAGTVNAERGAASVRLSKGNPIFEQDVVVTAARSRGQLLMRDGAKYALRPETRFIVHEYFMTGDEQIQPDGSVVISAQDSAVTELVKGGLRAITGAIGEVKNEDYELRTVAATMGIRGTKFSIVWCAGDCELPPGITATGPIIDGLYAGVSEGTVAIVNNTGEFLLHAGQYAYVRDRDSKPVRLIEKPVALIDTFPTAPAEADEAAADLIETLRVRTVTLPRGPIPGFPNNPGTEAPNGFPTGPNGPITANPPKNIENGPSPLVAMASGAVAGLNSSAFTAASRQGQRDVSGDDLTAFAVPVQGGNVDTLFGIGTARVFKAGQDSVTGFRWGRWTSGSGVVRPGGGSSINTNLNNESLHWVYGPPIEVTPVIPVTGTAYYSVIAGGTEPTDTRGNAGMLGGMSLFANFTTATVENLLQVFVGDDEWQGIGTGTISNELFNGSYDVFVNAVGGGDGSFSGFFAAPGANGFPTGAALTYSLNHTINGNNVSVSGAAVLHPTPAP